MNAQPVESFGDLLREKIAELDAADAPPVFVEDDPVDRLGLDARRCLQLVPNMPRSNRRSTFSNSPNRYFESSLFRSSQFDGSSI